MICAEELGVAIDDVEGGHGLDISDLEEWVLVQQTKFANSVPYQLKREIESRQVFAKPIRIIPRLLLCTACREKCATSFRKRGTVAADLADLSQLGTVEKIDVVQVQIRDFRKDVQARIGRAR